MLVTLTNDISEGVAFWGGIIFKRGESHQSFREKWVIFPKSYSPFRSPLYQGKANSSMISAIQFVDFKGRKTFFLSFFSSEVCMLSDVLVDFADIHQLQSISFPFIPFKLIELIPYVLLYAFQNLN